VTKSTTAPRSVTSLHSEDTVVAQRPTTPIAIGARTYTAKAPKYQVWWDVARLLEANDLAGEAVRRLAEEGDNLSLAEQRDLLEQIDAMPAFGGLEEAIIYGRSTEDGRFIGGFLRRCLSPDDWARVIADLDDDDSDVDLPDLYQAATELQSAFQGWFEARSQTMNLPTPKTTTTSPKTSTRRKTGGATARKK
jgi:hypothetical protein